MLTHPDIVRAIADWRSEQFLAETANERRVALLPHPEHPAFSPRLLLSRLQAFAINPRRHLSLASR